MGGHSEELVPAHWLDSQRLMVGLTLALVQEAGSAASLALMNEALKYLRPPVGAPDPELEPEYRKRLETIHPATLKRLTDLSPALLPAEWASHLPYWRKAYLKLQNDGERFPLVGAKLIADRILNSRLTPAQIQQVGAAELSPDWQGSFPRKALGLVLSRTQVLNREPREVLNALACFRRDRRPPRWEIVENALLQQLFIWPLLILETEQTSLEFSLPVLLRTATTENPLPAIVNAGALDASAWRNSVPTAVYAAKRLWQNKRGASTPWLKEAVERISASVDLGYAARIVEPYQVDLRLTGDSAEAYFALAVLGELTDPSAIENICATGKIIREGEHKDDEGGGDYPLEQPLYVSGKFAYARDSYFFDTFLTPKPSKGVASQRHIYVPREVEVRFHDPDHTYFSHFCDHVFGQKWRKQQYVRAPDLAEAFKPSDRKEKKKRRPEEDPQVEKVLEELKGNSKPALHIVDFPPEKVATALFVVNNRIDSKDRVGSYAFLRAVSDTINERMWWPIWELISGNPYDYPKFQFASSSRLAAEALAREMNKVRPNKADPRRAPDILVVAYTSVDLHFGSNSAMPGAPFERLRIEPIIQAINSLPEGSAMVRSPIPGIHEHIGYTRIVFVRDTQHAERLGHGNLSSLLADEEARNAIRCLSVFRHGFKRDHARHVLDDVQEDECDRILASLRRPVPGDVSPLVFAEGAGEYFLRRTEGDPTIKTEELAALHFKAANAITGLLAPREGAFRTKLRDAFSPRWVQEAQWHLQEAQRLIEPLDANRLDELRRAQQRVSRLAEPFGWTNLRWFIQAMRDRRIENRKPIPEAEFLVDDIKFHFKVRTPGTPQLLSYTHPTEYVLASRYCNELALQIGISSDSKDEFIRIRDKYLEKSLALIFSNSELNGNEQNRCIFAHMSSRYCMLIAHDVYDNTQVEYLEKRIEDLMEFQYFIDDRDKELFEYLGDRCSDPYQAMRWYRLGICNPGLRSMIPWPSLAFKYVGAAKVAGVSLSAEVKSTLDRLWLKSDPNGDLPPVGGLHTLPRAQDRWKIGRSAILEGEHKFGAYSPPDSVAQRRAAPNARAPSPEFGRYWPTSAILREFESRGNRERGHE